MFYLCNCRTAEFAHLVLKNFFFLLSLMSKTVVLLNVLSGNHDAFFFQDSFDKQHLFEI